MADRKVLATMVLVAGLPGKAEIVRRMASVLDKHVDGGRVVAEPADGESAAPIPEEDWKVRFVVEVHFRDTLEVTASRTLTLGPPPAD